MFGYIFGAVIYCLCGMAFISIGVYDYKSEKPITINTSIKPPRVEELKSVSEWNKKHGLLFGGYGALLILGYALSYFFIYNTYICLLLTVVLPFLYILFMIFYHKYLEKKLIDKEKQKELDEKDKEDFYNRF